MEIVEYSILFALIPAILKHLSERPSTPIPTLFKKARGLREEERAETGEETRQSLIN